MNIITIILVTLADKKAKWFLQTGKNAKFGYLAFISSIIFTGLNVIFFDTFYNNGLSGLFIFIAVISYYISIIRFIRPVEEKTHEVSMIQHI